MGILLFSILLIMIDNNIIKIMKFILASCDINKFRKYILYYTSKYQSKTENQNLMRNQLNFFSPAANILIEKVHYQPQVFYYTPSTKCISISVYQKNYDQNHSENQSISNDKSDQQDQTFLKQLQFKRYMLLDKTLNIVQRVQKRTEIIKYPVQYQKIVDKILQQAVVYWSLPNMQINVQVCAKKYMCYKDCNDFHIGRYLFVRKHNSFQIKSQLVSRDHCRIVFQQGFCNRSNSNTKNILLSRCKSYSLLSKLSNQLWIKIQQFLFKKDEYYISDTGSRNGTFVKKLKNRQKLKLKYNFSYQFDHADNYEYYIKVWRIKESVHNQSIEQHNSLFFAILKKFKQNQLYIDYQKINKTIITSKWVRENFQQGSFHQNYQSQLQQTKHFKKHKLNLVIILLQYFNDYKQFYCLICQQRQDEHFDIGIHYQINTSRNVFFDQNIFHGRIYHEKGKWNIIDAEGLKNKYVKIWTKIPSTDIYKLDLSQNYVLRLAHSYYLSLNFINFSSKIKEEPQA